MTHGGRRIGFWSCLPQDGRGVEIPQRYLMDPGTTNDMGFC